MNVRLIYASDGPASALQELDGVSLRQPVDVAEAGATLDAGAEGTIVAVLGRGEAYLVEFAEPFAALVELDRGTIDAIQGQNRDDLAAGRLAHRAS